MTNTPVVLLLLGLCKSIGAATIVVSATCTGVPTTLSPGAASCSNGVGTLVAMATASPGVVTSQAFYDGGGTPLNLIARAVASYDGDYLLTIHGGSGNGRFIPCLYTQSSEGGSGLFNGSGSATAQFGLFRSTSTGGQQLGGIDCNAIGGMALAFDVPTLFHLSLSSVGVGDSTSSSGGGTGRAVLSRIVVNDVLGNSMPNGTYTLTDISLTTPEPPTLLGVPVTLFLWTGYRRRWLLKRGGWITE
jgi:hypothetical protein